MLAWLIVKDEPHAHDFLFHDNTPYLQLEIMLILTRVSRLRPILSKLKLLLSF